MEYNKKVAFISRSIFALGLLCLFNYCDKTPPENTNFQPYPETSLDGNAGTWKTYVVTNSDIPVPAPDDNNSANYLAELAHLKAVTTTATETQRQIALKWGGNAILNWNEIARELAANYNVPPNNNPDGSYPAPDPSNPTAYPRFPFANPPYASRAFALLSVAQFDALVACWR